MNKKYGYIFLLLLSSLSVSYARTKRKPKVALKDDVSVQTYIPRIFDLEQNVISDNQFQQHYKLYEGYVKKRNTIQQDLVAAKRTDQNITYSIFRGLKIAETFARNGSLLHELYFENIKSGTSLGKRMLRLIERDFGSFEAFKEDLLACAGCARGWALTCYNYDDHKIQNYVLDAHNQTVPVLCIPLVVIDVYEHAYMIDYGINRTQYLQLLWDNINWDIVEQRIKRWIKDKGTPIENL